MELAFQDKYGKLMQHHWFGEGYLLIGFETAGSSSIHASHRIKPPSTRLFRPAPPMSEMSDRTHHVYTA